MWIQNSVNRQLPFFSVNLYFWFHFISVQTFFENFHSFVFRLILGKWRLSFPSLYFVKVYIIQVLFILDDLEGSAKQFIFTSNFTKICWHPRLLTILLQICVSSLKCKGLLVCGTHCFKFPTQALYIVHIRKSRVTTALWTKVWKPLENYRLVTQHLYLF